MFYLSTTLHANPDAEYPRVEIVNYKAHLLTGKLNQKNYSLTNKAFKFCKLKLKVDQKWLLLVPPS